MRILASVLLVIIGYSMSLSALAQPRAGGQAGYFVDFRSRPGYLFGHTSLFMAGSTGAASRATLTSPASTPSTAKPD